MKRALLTIKRFALRMFVELTSSEIQMLDINFSRQTMATQDEALSEKPLLKVEQGSGYLLSEEKPYGPMTITAKNLPGRVIPLPKRCAVCGSKKLAYDHLNVVTCESCDSILSVSEWWHPYWGGQIQSPRPKRCIE